MRHKERPVHDPAEDNVAGRREQLIKKVLYRQENNSKWC